MMRFEINEAKSESDDITKVNLTEGYQSMLHKLLSKYELLFVRTLNTSKKTSEYITKPIFQIAPC